MCIGQCSSPSMKETIHKVAEPVRSYLSSNSNFVIWRKKLKYYFKMYVPAQLNEITNSTLKNKFELVDTQDLQLTNMLL